MERTWIAIMVAGVGLLAAVALIRHEHNQVPDEDDRPVARAIHGSKDSGDSSASSRRARAPAGAGEVDERRSEIDERLGITDQVARARPHNVQQGRTGTGIVNDSDEQTATGDGAAGAGDSTDGRGGVGTNPSSHSDTQPATDHAGATPDPARKNGDKADDGLALSLKFDKSTLPDKGDTAPIVEHGITFDNQGARFAADAQFAIPNAGNVSGAAGTISFWLVPEWVGEVDTNASLVQLRTNTFENRIQIFKNGPYLRFIFCDNTGIESGVGISVASWQPNVGHVVTATWGDGVTSLYIDGQSVGSKEYNGELEVGPGTPLLIGSDHADGAPGARSAISDFKIYSRALSPDEVGALAAQSRR